MAKQSFLVVSLKESKTKKLAQVITNDTSVKILDFLANRESATETEIAKSLKLPISTVHYNLQALLETKMIRWDEFHYSEKGKEVKHYILANKYILIAPGRESGLRERLKAVLPITGILLAATFVIQYFSTRLSSVRLARSANLLQEKAVMTASDEAGQLAASGAAAPEAASAAGNSIASVLAGLTQSTAFWFAAGAFSALLLYFLFSLIREKKG
jgi:DNA-binding transcriptional ArsR family regulator